MNEDNIRQELDRDPFKTLRLHLMSGKTFDIVRAGAAWPLKDRLLVLINPSRSGSGGEGYDVIAYTGIERVEVLDIGKSVPARRKRA